MNNYDKWKLDTPDNHLKTFCNCDYCGQDIYIGEEYIEFNNGDRVHIESNCFEEYINEELNPKVKVAGEDVS